MDLVGLQFSKGLIYGSSGSLVLSMLLHIDLVDFLLVLEFAQYYFLRTRLVGEIKTSQVILTTKFKKKTKKKQGYVPSFILGNYVAAKDISFFIRSNVQYTVFQKPAG